MSKHANLDSQFFHVLQENTEIGRSKHSDKGTDNNPDQTIIYSRADREGLNDTAKQLVNYIKDNYNEVRNIRDIKPVMIQSFFNDKIDNSQKTIDKDWSHIGKIERMVEKVYTTVDLNWKENITKPESIIEGNIRTIAFDPKDWDKIKVFIDAKNKPSISDKGLFLVRDFGLRAESCTNVRTKDIRINGDVATLYIHKDKGGRSRTLTTKEPEVIDRLKELIKGKGLEDRLIPIQPDSLNKQLSRIEKDLGFRDYATAKTGCHALRKLWASEQFVKHMKEGMTKQEAMDRVSQDLGHGKGRNSLMEIYIGKETLAMYS